MYYTYIYIYIEREREMYKPRTAPSGSMVDPICPRPMHVFTIRDYDYYHLLALLVSFTIS